ncbi:MAG: gfo/Idh/MocA family oxidoreductase [Desulforudis sp.]|nr:MAG: gfo/Idh/MocA family oxidoreductase [Desulforudis sp.]
MTSYSAAVIGCGSIGALKPLKYDSPESPKILTHAHALYAHPRIGPIFFVDVDPAKARAAAARWGGHACDLEEAARADILIVATPTNTHLDVLMRATNEHSPKLIITEKPLGESAGEAQIIARMFRQENIPLLVDYIRRFDPEVQRLRKDISAGDDGALGRVWQCRVIYTRGLVHEGCHAFDLTRFLFGEFKGGQVLSPLAYFQKDRAREDPTWAVHAAFDLCPHVFLTPADGRKYSVFEIDILAERGRVVFRDHGLQVTTYQPEPEPVYGDYLTLPGHGSTRPTELGTALLNLLQNGLDHIERGAPLWCTGEDAAAVHQILENLKGGK